MCYFFHFSDRYGAPVKIETLKTILLLLNKGGARLRPFIPQLQTTFVKNLSDDSHIVRNLSAEGLTRYKKKYIAIFVFYFFCEFGEKMWRYYFEWPMLVFRALTNIMFFIFFFIFFFHFFFHFLCCPCNIDFLQINAICNQSGSACQGA